MKEIVAYENNQDDVMPKLVCIRKLSGMTQQDVGDKTGTEKANVSRLESSLHSPTFRVLKAYIEALGYDFKIVVRKR